MYDISIWKDFKFYCDFSRKIRNTHAFNTIKMKHNNEKAAIRTQGTWRKGIQSAHVDGRCSTYGGRTDRMDNFLSSSFFNLKLMGCFSTFRMWMYLCHHRVYSIRNISKHFEIVFPKVQDEMKFLFSFRDLWLYLNERVHFVYVEI